MRKTKIVCTIGPASRNEETLNEMIAAGMNIARLNFSHGTHNEHREVIDMVKRVRAQRATPLAIMLDTKGPEIRIKKFAAGSVVLETGAEFTLTTREVEGNEKEVSITFKDLPRQMEKGGTLLLDDGKIKLTVEAADSEKLLCRVVDGGVLKNNKGINVPGLSLEMPFLGEADKSDLLFGIENDVDFVAASFVRRRDDVLSLRKFLDYNGGHDIRIISKIENLEGIDNFDEILAASDGIMVARGDMGVEVEFERLPGLQKRFIKSCYRAGKMVITATQMLESMISNPTPTRAEITDVANAVFDGTSAVMLSGETAMGQYPVVAVASMAKIAYRAECDAFGMSRYENVEYVMDKSDTTNAICDAANTLARDIGARAIITVTKSGYTARRMSKFRPITPIIAATPLEKTFHQLALSWGVYPVLARRQKTSDDLFCHAIDCAKQIDAVSAGDKVVIAAGIPLDTPGNTNILKVETVDADDFENKF